MSFVNASFLWLLIPLSLYLWQREVKQSLQQNLRWVALGLLILAVARPVIPQAPTKERVEARSLVLALDLSASMRGEDIKPNRLQASKATIKAFLAQNEYDQVALVGFTINSLLLSPPTSDHQLVSMALDTLREEYILTKGTDIQKLLEKVAQLPDHEKLLILFSDGGDEVMDAGLSNFAKEQRIQVLAIAMASSQGASIPTKNQALLKDAEGNIVVSKLNRSLASFAQSTGGGMVPFRSPSDTAGAIQDWLDEQARVTHALSKERRSYWELYGIPTFLALVLVFVSATRFSLKVIAWLALVGVHLEAGVFDGYHLSQAYNAYENHAYNSTLEHLSEIETPSLESQRILAHTYYQQEKYSEAKSVLQRIQTTDPTVKQHLLYALGNCEAQLAYYEKAKAYYVQALQLGEDNDTRHNLQVVIFLQQEHTAQVGVTNPSSPERSNGSSDNAESKEQASTNDEPSGGSGGTGSQRTQRSTVQVVSSEQQTKRAMSSKAYDLINEGYIKEEKPW